MIFVDFPLAGYKFKELNGYCPALNMLIHIRGDGIVLPCKYSKITLGNLKESKLEEIFKKKSIFFPNKCKCCPSFQKCYGGCLANRKNLQDSDFYCLQ